MSVSRTELGCAGHFVASKSCRFRRHTQVGATYRISTVGDYFPVGSEKREAIGAGDDAFFETYVFRTTGLPADGNEDCGCIEVADWSEIEGRRWTTAGEAQRGHDSYVEKYAAIAASEAA